MGDQLKISGAGIEGLCAQEFKNKGGELSETLFGKIGHTFPTEGAY